MSRRWMAGPLVAASLVFGLAGCGGSDGVSTAASRELGVQVSELRAAAEERDTDAAQARIEQIRHDVRQLQDAGELSPEAADRILAATSAVETELAPITTTTTEPAPPPVDPPGQDDGDDDDDDRRGKKPKDD